MQNNEKKLTYKHFFATKILFLRKKRYLCPHNKHTSKKVKK